MMLGKVLKKNKQTKVKIAVEKDNSIKKNFPNGFQIEVNKTQAPVYLRPIAICII